MPDTAFRVQMRVQFEELVTAGVLTTDPVDRKQIWFDLEQPVQDSAVQIGCRRG